MAWKLNLDPSHVKVLVPLRGFSEADRIHGPLFDPPMNERFIKKLRKDLNPNAEVIEIDYHINDAGFAKRAVQLMDGMGMTANRPNTY
jgi:uncharacterized protein (UPF0261 family)